MRAVLLYGNRRVEVGDIPRPSLRPGWAIVESELSGICGTDKAFYTGSYKLFKAPLVPGHEVVGRVVEGPGDLIGLRVVSEINFPCWSCDYCRGGFYTHCPYKKTLGIDFDGGMAEFFAAPASALHVFRGPPELGIFVEPLAAILRALSLKPPKPQDRVAVIGAGNVALMTVQALKAMGFKVDVIARRGSRKASVLKGLADIVYVDEAEDNSYDIVFEASGDPEALNLAIRVTRPMGVIHLKSTPGSQAHAPMTWAVVKELQIIGSRCGTFKDFKLAIKLLENHIIEPRLDRVYTIEEAVEAFETSLDPQHFKIAVKP